MTNLDDITKKAFEQLQCEYHCNQLQEFIERNQSLLHFLFKKEFEAYAEAYYDIERKIDNLFDSTNFEEFKDKIKKLSTLSS